MIASKIDRNTANRASHRAQVFVCYSDDTISCRSRAFNNIKQTYNSRKILENNSNSSSDSNTTT